MILINDQTKLARYTILTRNNKTRRIIEA
jgi:hypothetical protein